MGEVPDGLVGGEQVVVRAGSQDVLISWHHPCTIPEGTSHGSEGVCITPTGDVVLVSRNGRRWEFPAGRPEGDETWEQTLRREVHEEACSSVRAAELLGFSRGECLSGPEKGLVLVRAIWRAEVDLGRWEPRFEMSHRQVVVPSDLASAIELASHPFARLIRCALREARLG